MGLAWISRMEKPLSHRPTKNGAPRELFYEKSESDTGKDGEKKHPQKGRRMTVQIKASSHVLKFQEILKITENAPKTEAKGTYGSKKPSALSAQERKKEKRKE